MIIVFFGAPGAGKGTQASKASAKYGLPRVSTGDLLREAVTAGNELGRQVKSTLDAGELVDDETMAVVVETRLDEPDCSEGALLDGYPRTLVQARDLDELLPRTSHGQVDLVLHLKVSEAQIVARLSRRRACPRCGANYHLDFNPPVEAGTCDRCGTALIQREDDREPVVRERIQVYRTSTSPLIDYYRDRDVLREIDGDGGIEEVFTDIDAAIAGAARS